MCSSLSHFKHKATFLHSFQPGISSDAGIKHSELLLEANLLHFKQAYFAKQ